MDVTRPDPGQRSRSAPRALLWLGTLGLLAPVPFGCALCAPPSADAVVVNEVLARNSVGIVDEAGEADDWIELHNPGAAAVDLSGYWLSDDITDPKKHRIADGEVLAAGDFLLVWADDQPEQGPRHASFRLSGDGEQVVLTDPLDRLVDQVSFGPQEVDVSEGHFPDATGPWVPLATPTPGAPNAAGGGADAGPPPPLPRFSELSPLPGVAATDLSGASVDAAWVELFNPHAEAVELAGLGLDRNVNAAAPEHRLSDELPALEPLAFRVIFLDGETGADHAFLVDAAPVELALFDRRGNRGDIVRVDAAPPAGATLGRVGADESFVPTTPTPGATNEALPIVDGGFDGGFDGGYDGGFDGGYDAGFDGGSMSFDAGVDAGDGG